MKTIKFISALVLFGIWFSLPVSVKKSKLTDPKVTAETILYFKT